MGDTTTKVARTGTVALVSQAEMVGDEATMPGAVRAARHNAARSTQPSSMEYINKIRGDHHNNQSTAFWRSG